MRVFRSEPHINRKSDIRTAIRNQKNRYIEFDFFFLLTDVIHKTVFLKFFFFIFLSFFFFIWFRFSFHDIFLFIWWQRFLLFLSLYSISFFISTDWRSCTLECHSSCINSRLNCFWYHHEIYMISFSRLFSITDNVQNKCHFFILNICMQLVITWLFQNHCQASSWWHFSFTIQRNHLKQSNKNNSLCLTFQWYQLWDFHRIEQFLRLLTFCLKWYALFFLSLFFFVDDLKTNSKENDLFFDRYFFSNSDVRCDVWNKSTLMSLSAEESIFVFF